MIQDQLSLIKKINLLDIGNWIVTTPSKGEKHEYRNKS